MQYKCFTAFFFNDKHSYGINFEHTKLDSLIFQNNNFTGGDKSINIILNGNFKKINIINNRFNLAGGINMFFWGDQNSICRIENNIFKDTYISYLSSELNIIKFWGSESHFVINNNLFNGIKYNLPTCKSEVNVFLLNTKYALIYNNVIKNINFNKPIELAPGFIISSLVTLVTNYSENLKFYYNSVYIPQGGENGFYTDESIFTGFNLSLGRNVEVKNNIFVLLQGNKPNTTTNSSAKIYNFASENDINNLQSNHNIYFVANHTQNYFYSFGNNGYSFNQWQTAYPTQDQNSYWEMPNVVSKDNLHLTTNCDRGTPIPQVLVDYEGFTRSTTTPDIGAYEFILGIICNDITCAFDEVVFEYSSPSNVKSYLWNFGDSQTSTEQNPTHEYTTAGTYTVTLTVTYNDNSTQTTTKDIEVVGKPEKPVIEHE